MCAMPNSGVTDSSSMSSRTPSRQSPITNAHVPIIVRLLPYVARTITPLNPSTRITVTALPSEMWSPSVVAS